MKNPYLQIALYSFIILLSTILVQQISGISLPAISWFALLFFVGLTAGTYSLLAPSLASNSKNFVVVFVGTQGIRMFFSLSFLILYMLFSSKIETVFVVYFLLLYLFFTAFEISLLLYKLRADLKKGPTKSEN
jgi:hypothetical protein